MSRHAADMARAGLSLTALRRRCWGRFGERIEGRADMKAALQACIDAGADCLVEHQSSGKSR